jgi:hypothetical protein
MWGGVVLLLLLIHCELLHVAAYVYAVVLPRTGAMHPLGP